MSVLGSGDSLHIDVTTSVDFTKFYCDFDSSMEEHYGKFANFAKNFVSFQYSNPTIATLGFHAWYYLKITKYKGGVTYINYDTLYNVNGFNYQIQW